MNQNAKTLINDAILKDLRDTLNSLEYGTVTIKVHQSKIVHIEVTRSKRFNEVWDVEAGGGI